MQATRTASCEAVSGSQRPDMGLPKLLLWLLESIRRKEHINYKAAASLRVLCSQGMARCIPGTGG